MNKLSYKGYELESKPHQIRESQEWTLDVTIYNHTATGVKHRPFSAASRFKTMEDAVEAGLSFGKDIIDGMVSGCSVENL